MKFICHVTSRNRMVRVICDFAVRHMTPNHKHPFVKFDGYRSREKEFIAFLICYITLCNHDINRLFDFIDNRPVLEPTSLSSLLGIGLAKVE